jgi:DNA polymerase elongation subunit (family B)
MNKLLKKEVLTLLKKDRDPSYLKFYPREDEELLLLSIPAMLHKMETDIIGGWFVEGFDIPVTIARMEHKRIRPQRLSEIGLIHGRGGKRPIVGIPIFDTMDGWKKLLKNKPVSAKLDYVANKELNAGKMAHYGPIMGEAWYSGKMEEIIAYNILDVVLTKVLNEKLNILPYHLAVAHIAGSDIEETFWSSRLLDSYIFHKVRGELILPTKRRGHKEEKFKGATVFEPPVGLHHNIIVLDLASIYPNTIISCNIDPTTIISEHEELPEQYITCPNGTMFKKDPRGIIPGILVEMIWKRKEYRAAMKPLPKGSDEWKALDAMQFAFKTLTNAFYGVMNYVNFRMMNVDCGDAVTSVGRAIIDWSAKIIRTISDAYIQGYRVIYADTDSLFIQGDPNATLEELIETGYSLAKQVNATYDDFAKVLNVDEHYFNIEFEKIYRRIFFSVKETGEGTKKKYGGRLCYAT